MTENNLDFSTEERLHALIDTSGCIHQSLPRWLCRAGQVLTASGWLSAWVGPVKTARFRMTTLNGWVAGTVRQFFPDIEKIEAVGKS